MSSLTEKFAELEKLLLNQRRTLALHAGVPFVLLIYDLNEEQRCREEQAHLAVKLRDVGLTNRKVGSQHAVDLFKLRILDSPCQGEIERLLHQAVNFIDTEAIAFQIKTEEDLLADAPVGEADRKVGNHISTIMYRQWLAKRGFSTTMWVGRLELELESLGRYQAFKEKVQEQEGKPWEEVRRHDMVVRDAAVKALCALLPERYATEAVVQRGRKKRSIASFIG
ncbi:MAG: hypothetical protein ACP5JJ_16280 [Anaerolineae bacterium]